MKWDWGLNKMGVTMNAMELIHADKLRPEQLMEDDLIKVDGDIVKVLEVDSDATGDIYFIKIINDFGEEDVAEYDYDSLIDLYCYIED